jgi:putative secretion ATPase (PEP-CTERM system associated)
LYAEFFHLTGLPFQLTPDSRFFFESSVHSKAMAHLTYGLNQGEGFIVITGDVGAGKTTLVEYLCSGLDPQRYTIARMLTTQTSADDTLRLVAAGFGIPTDTSSKAELLQHFEAALVANFRGGRRALLVVDEAQNLSVPAIEELRMLSNVVVDHQPPLQCFLLGQPQFRTTLALPQLEQLRQRILASYHLGPMSEEETRAYIEHRLRLVGWKDDPHFTDGAFQEVFAQTGGIPRKINSLCSRLMLFGFLEETHVIEEEAVAQVADELKAEMADPIPPDRADPNRMGTELEAFDRRLARIEERIDKNDLAIRRALAVITSRIEGESS